MSILKNKFTLSAVIFLLAIFFTSFGLGESLAIVQTLTFVIFTRRMSTENLFYTFIPVFYSHLFEECNQKRENCVLLVRADGFCG